MDSAIPVHLQCPRTRARRTPDAFVPPFPSTVARFGTSVRQMAMAYFGVQFRGATVPRAATDALRFIAAGFAREGGSGHWDRAQFVDASGFTNVISIGYWQDAAGFDAWHAAHGAGWTRGGDEAVGLFAEVLKPRVERFETLFSSAHPEGIACLAEHFSDVVQEHAYWGGARDRIPLSQTHDLAPLGAPRIISDGLRQVVIPHDNLCLIRSGQDWSATEGDERRMYLDDVEPVLRAGMNFLRDDGLKIGCLANRYMTVLDAQDRPTQKSFGMSWWRSLSALERWAEFHPTHVAIFGAAMRYLGTLGPAAQLKLYHEVTVAAAAEQHFEYRNCHPDTGMLRAARLPVAG
jgi:aldoxime dehydratase